MPTYISLVKYTQKGIENVKDSPKRLNKFKKTVKALGGKVQAFYLTMGRYDVVYIVEATDDKTAASMILALGAEGNVASETLKAFTEKEFVKIISAIS